MILIVDYPIFTRPQGFSEVVFAKILPNVIDMEGKRNSGGESGLINLRPAFSSL